MPELRDILAVGMVDADDLAGTPARTVAKLMGRWTDDGDVGVWDGDLAHEWHAEANNGNDVDDYVLAFARSLPGEPRATWTGDVWLPWLDPEDNPAARAVQVYDDGYVEVYAVDRHGDPDWCDHVLILDGGKAAWRQRLEEWYVDTHPDTRVPLAGFPCPVCSVPVGLDDAVLAHTNQWSGADCPACGTRLVVHPDPDDPTQGWAVDPLTTTGDDPACGGWSLVDRVMTGDGIALVEVDDA